MPRLKTSVPIPVPAVAKSATPISTTWRSTTVVIRGGESLENTVNSTAPAQVPIPARPIPIRPVPVPGPETLHLILPVHHPGLPVPAHVVGSVVTDVSVSRAVPTTDPVLRLETSVPVPVPAAAKTATPTFPV